MSDSIKNIEKNRLFYNEQYASVNVGHIIEKLKNIDLFFNDAIRTDTSWVCMYKDKFEKVLSGKKVLELGCGNCLNAAVMAKLGAEVWANDISEESGNIIQELNKTVDFSYPIRFVKGNFLEAEIRPNFFDIVVGKAFLHHLTHELEHEFLRNVALILKKDGRARFVEPAVNSEFLDKIRWAIPVQNRPSSFNRKKFKDWKNADPHPERDNSGKHYKSIGSEFFSESKIYSIGSIERFHRFFPNVSWNRRFRRISYKIESCLPNSLRYILARTQTIDYFRPKRN